MRLSNSTSTVISATLYKFGILINGLGITRSIDFYNKDYLNSHPDIVVEKKLKSPDEDKSLADSKALLPTLRDFKSRHHDIKPEIFLGDAAFDTIKSYKTLFEDFGFKKAFIPLKVKLSMNKKTLHADLLLAGISQLLTVVVADKINQRQHIRSLKSFIA